MKVLVFTTQFYQFGGAERLAVELAEELNKHGIHADILSMYTEDLPGVAEAKAALLQEGIPAVHFLCMKAHPSITRVVQAMWKLRRLIREHRYDIIETSMASPAVIAAWATLAMPTRLLAGLHAMYTRETWQGLNAWLWRLTMRLNRRVQFYAISNMVGKSLQQFARVSENRVRTVYNAINPQFFCVNRPSQVLAKELGLENETRFALCVGRLVQAKGIETLLIGLGPILKERNLHLVYIGSERPPENIFPDDESNLLQRMRTMIAENGWDTHVHFLGQRSDVAELMAGADILVHPTWFEGFGLVLIEAMATGLPVIATNVDAIPEIVEGTGAILVRPRDPEALRRGVESVLDLSPDVRQNIVQVGQKHAGNFLLARRVDRLTEMLYNLSMGYSLQRER